MIGFIAGDPRPSEDLAWIATIGVLPELPTTRHRAGTAAGMRETADPDGASACACGFPTNRPSASTSRKATWQWIPGGNIITTRKMHWSWKKSDNLSTEYIPCE